ncbi:hypothetical protein, partial [Pandoraea anhela]
AKSLGCEEIMDNLPIAFVVIIAILAAMLVWYLRDPKLVADGAVSAARTTWSVTKKTAAVVGVICALAAAISLLVGLGGWQALAFVALIAAITYWNV